MSLQYFYELVSKTIIKIEERDLQEPFFMENLKYFQNEILKLKEDARPNAIVEDSVIHISESFFDSGGMYYRIDLSASKFKCYSNKQLNINDIQYIYKNPTID